MPLRRALLCLFFLVLSLTAAQDDNPGDHHPGVLLNETGISLLTREESNYKHGDISLRERVWAKEGDDVEIRCSSDYGYKGEFVYPPSVPDEAAIARSAEDQAGDEKPMTIINSLYDVRKGVNDGFYYCIIYHNGQHEGHVHGDYSIARLELIIGDLCEGECEGEQWAGCEGNYEEGTFECEREPCFEGGPCEELERCVVVDGGVETCTCDMDCENAPNPNAYVCTDTCEFFFNECNMREQICRDGIEREVDPEIENPLTTCLTPTYSKVIDVADLQEVPATKGEVVLLSAGIIEIGSPPAKIEWVEQFGFGDSGIYLGESPTIDYTVEDHVFVAVTVQQCKKEWRTFYEVSLVEEPSVLPSTGTAILATTPRITTPVLPSTPGITTPVLPSTAGPSDPDPVSSVDPVTPNRATTVRATTENLATTVKPTRKDIVTTPDPPTPEPATPGESTPPFVVTTVKPTDPPETPTPIVTPPLTPAPKTPTPGPETPLPVTTTEESAIPDDFTRHNYRSCSILPGGILDNVYSRANEFDLTCTHVLAASVQGEVSWFVYGTFDVMDGARALASMTAYVGNTIFEFQRGWIINVGGGKLPIREEVPVPWDYQSGECTIAFANNHLHAHCPGMFDIYYDGIMAGHVRMLPHLRESSNTADSSELLQGEGEFGLCWGHESGWRANWQVGPTDGRCEVQETGPIQECGERNQQCRYPKISPALKMMVNKNMQLPSYLECGVGATQACTEISCGEGEMTARQRCAIEQAYNMACELKYVSSEEILYDYGAFESCPEQCEWREGVVKVGCPQEKLPYKNCNFRA